MHDRTHSGVNEGRDSEFENSLHGGNDWWECLRLKVG